MELRRTLIAGLMYPIIVFFIATLVFLFTWSTLFPVMQRILPDLVEQEMPNWFQWLTWTVERGGLSLFVAWVVLVVLAATWFARTHHALHFGTSSGRWPSISAVNHAGRTASFAEILALLIEHQVPLFDSLTLAGAASGDRRIRNAADELAKRVRLGALTGSTPRGLPPLLSWLILTNISTPQLAKVLRQTARGLHDRAVRQSITLAVYLPIFLSATVGAAVAVYYAILVMTPFYYLLLQLSQP
jgi:type II secretory pathway component PulF